MNIKLISDFNIEILARYIENDPDLKDVTEEDVSAEAVSYGQMHHALFDAPTKQSDQDAAVIWALPESASSSLSKILNFDVVDASDIEEELVEFAELVINYSKNIPITFVASLVNRHLHRSFGLLNYQENTGISNILAKANLTLAEKFSPYPNIFLLDAEQWIIHAGPNSFSTKMWYAANVPFENDVFKFAASDIISGIRGSLGKSKRLVVIDLDNTIWGDVVGEVGWEKIRLGGHDLIGEAFSDFQRGLKNLTKRGVQIALCSKNDEATALNVFEKNSEMILQMDDIAGWKIDWNDKASNIMKLAEELNFGLESIVFIDDSLSERALVEELLPQVLVPNWPSDPTEYLSALQNLNCFNSNVLSKEDRDRTKMYVAERKRRDAIQLTSSYDEWLTQNEILVQSAELNNDNRTRSAQLLNKTNQFNATTRRLSEIELGAWAQASDNHLFVFSVSDRFGKYGLTGIASVTIADNQATLVDFLMSCRVMGRRVEDAILSMTTRRIIEFGINKLNIKYSPTKRNNPTLAFLEGSSLQCVDSHHFLWEGEEPYPCPKFITIQTP